MEVHPQTTRKRLSLLQKSWINAWFVLTLKIIASLRLFLHLVHSGATGSTATVDCDVTICGRLLYTCTTNCYPHSTYGWFGFSGALQEKLDRTHNTHQQKRASICKLIFATSLFNI